jgi:glutamate formiminotransferase/formiminotetrahydrofolate cyclodeaminase
VERQPRLGDGGQRHAVLDAALAAYEDAGLSGLCAEGRWEAAVQAMRGLDLTAIDTPAMDLTSSLSHVVATVGGAAAPPPSGGSVAAAVGALAAALTQMVAGLTAGRPKYADVAAEMQHAAHRGAALAAELLVLVGRDAAAVEAVARAYRLPKTPEHAASVRADAIERAMRSATEAPFEIARAAAAVADVAATVAERGNRNAVADAAVAALLAEAVCRASALTVRVNVPALRDVSAARQLEREAAAFAQAASDAGARAAAVVSR